MKNLNLGHHLGWEAFTDVKELVDLVWDTLTLTDHGGEWVYLNFTSASSIWEHKSTGESLAIAYSSSDPGCMIEELVANLSNAEPNSELSELVAKLETKYALVRIDA